MVTHCEEDPWRLDIQISRARPTKPKVLAAALLTCAHSLAAEIKRDAATANALLAVEAARNALVGALPTVRPETSRWPAVALPGLLNYIATGLEIMRSSAPATQQADFADAHAYITEARRDLVNRHA